MDKYNLHGSEIFLYKICKKHYGNFQKRISHYICRSATPSAFLTTKHTKHTKHTKKAKIVSIYRIFPYFLYFLYFFVCFVVKKAAAGDIRQFSDRCSVGYPFLEIAILRDKQTSVNRNCSCRTDKSGSRKAFFGVYENFVRRLAFPHSGTDQFRGFFRNFPIS